MRPAIENHKQEDLLVQVFWHTINVSGLIASVDPLYYREIRGAYMDTANQAIDAYLAQTVISMAKSSEADRHIRDNWQAWHSSNVAPFLITGF